MSLARSTLRLRGLDHHGQRRGTGGGIHSDGTATAVLEGNKNLIFGNTPDALGHSTDPDT